MHRGIQICRALIATTSAAAATFRKTSVRRSSTTWGGRPRPRHPVIADAIRVSALAVCLVVISWKISLSATAPSDPNAHRAIIAKIAAGITWGAAAACVASRSVTASTSAGRMLGLMATTSARSCALARDCAADAAGAASVRLSEPAVDVAACAGADDSTDGGNDEKHDCPLDGSR
jgi:hypothetical protein